MKVEIITGPTQKTRKDKKMLAAKKQKTKKKKFQIQARRAETEKEDKIQNRKRGGRRWGHQKTENVDSKKTKKKSFRFKQAGPRRRKKTRIGGKRV